MIFIEIITNYNKLFANPSLKVEDARQNLF